MTWSGACHCGNVGVLFEGTSDGAAFEVRACRCSFCRKHGVRAVSDPGGRVRISVRDAGRLERYRFGLRTADFLICGECGIYVAAVVPDAGGSYAIVNLNVLERADDFTRPAAPVSYDDETAAERRARRLARWTPATLDVPSR